MKNLLPTKNSVCFAALLFQTGLSFQVSYPQFRQQHQNIHPTFSLSRSKQNDNIQMNNIPVCDRKIMHLYQSFIPNEDDMLINSADDDDDDDDDDDEDEDFLNIAKELGLSSSEQKEVGELIKNGDDDEEFPLDVDVNLGINIGTELGLSSSEQKNIVEQGKAIVDQAFESQLRNMEKERTRMKKDTEREAGVRNMASNLRAQYEAEKLMERIDRRSDEFLSKTKEVRESTKLAAMADRNMQGNGIELGSWGRDKSGNVVTTGFKSSTVSTSSTTSSFTQSKGSLLDDDNEWGEVISVQMENKVLFIDDDTKEAQALLKEVCTKLEKLNIKTEIISHIRPVPMGGLDSQTVVFFSSSFSEKKTVMTMLDRVLSRTASGNGRVSIPPSHIICISALGTTKASSNGLMGFMMTGLNGKLDRYREMEEGIVSKCRTRFGKMAFDHSIIKFGTLGSPNKKINSPISITNGDAGSGEIDTSTAADVLLQTIAFQFHSRNTTLSAVGSSNSQSLNQDEWDDLFLSLDGPELLRIPLPFETDRLQQKCQFYVQNWAKTKFVDAKSTGLSTPVAIENTLDGVKIVFKKTSTGSAYKSKEEERKLEQRKPYSAPSSSTSSTKPALFSNTKELVEGGIQIIFEKDFTGGYRLRAKRCNLNDDTVVKEMSEETILSKLKGAIDYFINNQD